MNIYALYDGEHLVTDGTLKEIAGYTGLKPGTVKWYGTPSGRNKGNMILIKIEEDDDMFIGSNQPRSKRSHSVYAPTLTNDENERTGDVETIFRHSRPAEWKPEPYTRMLFDACFKKWKE